MGSPAGALEALLLWTSVSKGEVGCHPPWRARKKTTETSTNSSVFPAVWEPDLPACPCKSASPGTKPTPRQISDRASRCLSPHPLQGGNPRIHRTKPGTTMQAESSQGRARYTQGSPTRSFETQGPTQLTGNRCPWDAWGWGGRRLHTLPGRLSPSQSKLVCL